MWILLLSLVLLFLAVLVARLRKTSAGERNAVQTDDEGVKAEPRPEGCCGLHEVCEKELLLAAEREKPVYYEDEELDAFKGRESDSYTDAETEQFEEVMTTMRPDEVAGWLRSLQMRGVSLPDALKDEAFMLMEG